MPEDNPSFRLLRARREIGPEAQTTWPRPPFGWHSPRVFLPRRDRFGGPLSAHWQPPRIDVTGPQAALVCKSRKAIRSPSGL